MIRKTFSQQNTNALESLDSDSQIPKPALRSKEVADYSIDDFDQLLSPVESPNLWQAQGKGLLVGFGAGLLLAIGVTQFLLPQSPSVSSPEPIASPTAEIPVAPAKSVTVSPVKIGRVEQKLQATGSIAAFEQINLYSQASNLQIREVLADEGDYVQEGQLLVLLDDSMQQARLSQARARIAEAEARLAELKAGSRAEDIQQAKSNIQAIEAELDQRKADWEYAKIQVQRNEILKEEGAIELNLFDEIKTNETTKKALVSQTEARLRQAQQDLTKLENGVRPEVIAQAVAQVANTKAQYQMTLSEVQDTKILSPVNGKISRRDARVGNVTSPSQKLFTIIENGRLELRLKVPETQLTAIRQGQTVLITSDGDKTFNLRGKVREIEPRIDETSRQGIIKVDLPGQPNLKPGMFLRGAIVIDNKTSLTVPLKAVLPKPDGDGQVYVIQPDETVKATDVVLGEMLPQGRIEIVEGLKTSDQVVVKGAAYLNNGDRISVISEQ
ncbi:MAG: efflux RND transporter periplasmic adaptor subunit [Microcystaceae cyanobacterium]